MLLKKRNLYFILFLFLFTLLHKIIYSDPLQYPRFDKIYYYVPQTPTRFEDISCPTDFSFWNTKIDTDVDIYNLRTIRSDGFWLPIVLQQDISPIVVTTQLFWADGSEAQLRWDLGEPNNIIYPENCIILTSSNMWMDFPCTYSDTNYFLCSFLPICFGKKANEVDVCNVGGDCVNTDTCDCSDGYYRNTDGKCYACPDGKWSTKGNNNQINDCFDCQTGYYCKNGVIAACPSYYYHSQFTTGYDKCLICPEGYYMEITPQRRNCLPCPPGYYCDSTRTKIPCPSNRYSSDFAQKQCTICPQGNYVTTDGIYCFPCVDDEYCPGNKIKNKCDVVSVTGCEICPDGYICMNGKSFQCPDGYYIDVISKSCLLCPVGKKCLHNMSPILCENEYYTSIEGNIECQECLVNYYSNYTHSGCFPCVDGAHCNGKELIICPPTDYYFNGTCIECPLGFFCIDSIRMECPPGTYNDENGSNDCKLCPPGTFLPFTTSKSILDCGRCPINKTSSYGATTCHYCPDGMFYNITIENEIERCQSCPPGTYSKVELFSIGCKLCPAGYKNEYEGSDSCEVCEPGYISIEGSIYCIACPPGSYSHSNRTQCELCPFGTYNPYYGASSIDYCIKCEKGGFELGEISNETCKLCPSGFINYNFSCLPCSPGSYSDESDSFECKLCPPGTYNPYYKGTSVEYCIPCLPGSYALNYGSESCTLCSPGEFLSINGSSTPCIACSSGNYSSIGESECHECSIGSYSFENSSKCTICPTGSFFINITLPCVECQHGTFQELEGQVSCTICKEGTYNPNTGSNTSSHCIPCPIGTYSTSKGAFDEKFCQICPPGFVCDIIGLGKPKPCPKGTYSTKNTSMTFSDCTLCPAGTYSNVEGLNDPEGCIPCPKGTYNSLLGSPIVEICQKCPLGTYLGNYPGTSIKDCIPCGPGTFSLNAEYCLECPLGTYNSKFNAYQIEDCIRCDVNEITYSTGSKSKSDCIKCPLGSYELNSICYECPPGTYFNQSVLISGKSTSIDDCIPCGYGLYQPFSGAYNQSSCISCEKGTFGPSLKNSICLNCGKGFYSEIDGGTLENCFPCPSGTWSDIEKSNSISHCNKCLSGTYNNETGSSSIKNCIPCPVGYMIDIPGSSECIKCPNGTCNLLGSSFYFSYPENTELIDIKDPSLIVNPIKLALNSLKLWISVGFLISTLVCLFCSTCCILIISRKFTNNWLKKLDFAFSIRPRKNKKTVNSPTSFGGLLSVIVLILFIFQLIPMIFNFLSNNKILLENVSIDVVKLIRGNFIFETILVGKHSTCNGTYEISGFEIENSTVKFEQVLEYFNETLVEGCKSIVRCTNCLPLGNSQDVFITYEGNFMTSMILFSSSVNHYVKNTYYQVSGFIISEEKIFTGKYIPHKISLNLNLYKYISISFMNAFYETIGYSPIESINQGYTIQLLNKLPGSSYEISNFEIKEGMKIHYDVNPVSGIRIVQEYSKQNFFIFCAQTLSLFSISLIIGNLIFNIYEFFVMCCLKRNKKILPHPINNDYKYLSQK